MSLLQTMNNGHKGGVYSIIHMGIHVWTGSSDSNIFVWDVSSYELLFSLGEQGGYVKTMIKVDWQLWVIASKCIKVWTAKSLWSDSSIIPHNSQEIGNLRTDLEEARFAIETTKNEAARREQQLIDDLKKLRDELDSLRRIQEKSETIDKLAQLEAMKKQAEDNLSKIASQARQCHEKLLKKIVNLEARMKHSKEEKNKWSNDLSNKLAEAENLKRISISELEKLPYMKDEYERMLAERGAEKSKLASDAAWMKEHVELKLAEIKKLESSINREKLNCQMESKDAKEKFEKQIANLQERNKILEDENAKFATKVLSLKEALNTKRKEKKEKRVQELETILNDANQLLKKVQEKYYEKSQEHGSEQLKDVVPSKQMHPAFKPTCSKDIYIQKKCQYNECCSKFKNSCKVDSELDFYNKYIDSYHKKMCFHTTRPTIKSSTNFPINMCCSQCMYQQIPKCLKTNPNFSLKSHCKNLI